MKTLLRPTPVLFALAVVTLTLAVPTPPRAWAEETGEQETAASWQSGVAAAGFVEDPTDRVVAFLEDGTVGGEVGVYLKEVGGDAIAEHNARFELEPASAIKALIHFHAMRQIQEGEEIDGGPVTLDRQIP